jgi:hypothetical protein
MSMDGAVGLLGSCGALGNGAKAINGDFGGRSSAANAENDLGGTMTVSTIYLFDFVPSGEVNG